MTSFAQRALILLLTLLSATGLRAEKVADLPVPTSYVNDFAHVLTAGGAQNVEDLCLQVHQKADAEVVVVTINSLDDGQSVEDFTAKLEEKWKLGKKGQDRSALYVLVLNPHKLRIETGYGLEGILNDAKVGAILDQAQPFAKSGNYDQAMLTGVQGLANVIAADKGVTLTPTVHRYRYQQVPPQQGSGRIGIGQIALGIGLVLLFIILASTGNLGWAFVILQMFLGGGGGGGGGGRGDDDEGGGGFGGVGGGSSGGGGASRDF